MALDLTMDLISGGMSDSGPFPHRYTILKLLVWDFLKMMI